MPSDNSADRQATKGGFGIWYEGELNTIRLAHAEKRPDSSDNIHRSSGAIQLQSDDRVQVAAIDRRHGKLEGVWLQCVILGDSTV